MPLGAGTAGHSTRFSCKRPVSCGSPAGIPARKSTQQCQSGRSDIFDLLSLLDPEGQGKVLAVFVVGVVLQHRLFLNRFQVFVFVLDTFVVVFLSILRSF